MKKLNVGILGFGTVGGGAYEILTKNHDLITQRTGVSIDVVKALVRRKRDGIPAHLTTEDPDDILKNPAIDVVVETMGGIEPATSFMLQAMENGKHVVTANKAAVAASYEKLQTAAAKNHVKLLFEVQRRRRDSGFDLYSECAAGQRIFGSHGHRQRHHKLYSDKNDRRRLRLRGCFKRCAG